MPIGPALPPHLAHLAGGSSSRSPSPPGPRLPVTNDKEDLHDDDDDDYGPALPPHLLASRRAASPPRHTPILESTPNFNPVLPGPVLPTDRGKVKNHNEEEESDDEIGPRPVMGEVIPEERSAVQEFMEREARWAKEREVSSEVDSINIILIYVCSF